MVSGRPETLAIEPGSNIEIEVTAEFTCAEPGEFEITYTAVVEWTLTSDMAVARPRVLRLRGAGPAPMPRTMLTHTGERSARR